MIRKLRLFFLIVSLVCVKISLGDSKTVAFSFLLSAFIELNKESAGEAFFTESACWAINFVLIKKNANSGIIFFITIYLDEIFVYKISVADIFTLMFSAM